MYLSFCFFLLLICLLNLPIVAELFAIDLPWLLDLTVSFQAQYALVAAVMIPWLIKRFNKSGWVLAIIATTAIGYNFSRFYWPVSDVEPSNDKALRVFQANISYYNNQLAALKQQISHFQPDILVLFEYNHANKDFYRELAADFQSIPPEYGIPSGIAVFSKYPISSRKVHNMASSSVNIIEMTFFAQVQQTPIRLFALHPPSPRTEKLFELRNKTLSRLEDKIQRQGQLNQLMPTLVMGDLNTAPWSGYLPDFAFGQFLPCFAGQGYGATWHLTSGWLAPLLATKIDYCFYSSHFQITDYQLIEIAGSDHKGLSYQLQLIE
ncbi:endonuclease/exonuclease/phosphatase family protein [Catenovulum sp. SM1970]|uniref:endonuclease/exonuclease/phosphatase family protein n=1 Tax=Marinifaba aquimaris TaxID=2741323 RepID=UPI001571D026|nr:endonuclease/exonuclease/phosphatase family protein [Marinifaba aquimaris]NTS76179.1 endonuclease/exonuclease/phosphatase family protein [Marinifaba aquimaris]